MRTYGKINKIINKATHGLLQVKLKVTFLNKAYCDAFDSWPLYLVLIIVFPLV